MVSYQDTEKLGNAGQSETGEGGGKDIRKLSDVIYGRRLNGNKRINNSTNGEFLDNCPTNVMNLESEKNYTNFQKSHKYCLRVSKNFLDLIDWNLPPLYISGIEFWNRNHRYQANFRQCICPHTTNATKLYRHLFIMKNPHNKKKRLKSK